jgi:TPR repeat protein
VSNHCLAWAVSAAILSVLCTPTHADALKEVLSAHDNGQDESEFVTLTPLASAGDPAAQFKLGVMYARGWVGGQVDYSASRAWYQKAADQRFTSAEVALGALYFHGWGVTRDLNMTHYWWAAAAAQGDPIAKSNLAVVDAMMPGK